MLAKSVAPRLRETFLDSLFASTDRRVLFFHRFTTSLGFPLAVASGAATAISFPGAFGAALACIAQLASAISAMPKLLECIGACTSVELHVLLRGLRSVRAEVEDQDFGSSETGHTMLGRVRRGEA
mmetsp:Transcript_4061/g.10150  ORF Transcript_4061/g.10150 Transcript_4061/m.10150 type:complete len:126 (+) Transcript_4061:627-1004(+)